MKNKLKLILIGVLIASILAVALLVVLPFMRRSTEYFIKIEEYTNEKNAMENEINDLYGLKSDYYVLNSLFDKYNTQIPLTENIPVLTDQIYEIGKYSGVKIYSIIFNEVLNYNAADNKAGAINVDLSIEGSYYQILTFINTLEIMPRFLKIEIISLDSKQAEQQSYTNEGASVILSGEISFKTFYDKSNYDN